MKLLLLSVLTVSMPFAAQACSCMPFDSAEEHIEAADVAFVGTAVEAGAAPGGQTDWPAVYQTRFRVSQSFKGPHTPFVGVQHRRESSMCGVSFAMGRKMLVLASQRPDGTVATNLCIAASTEEQDALIEVLEAQYPSR